MTVSAAIRFVQGATDGGPGRALIGVAGTIVQASNANDTPDVVSWTWEWIDVAHGSALPIGVVQDGAIPIYSFTPDVQDSYLLHLTVKDRFGNVAEDFRAFTVLRASGRYVPPYRGTNASMNYGGSATGWSVSMYAWLNFLDGLGGGGGAPGGASGNIQFNNAGAFAGDSVINRSGVAFRDLTINSTHLLTINAGLAATLDGATLTIGGSGTATLQVGTSGITPHVEGGDAAGLNKFAALVENPTDPAATGFNANVLRLKGGATAGVGTAFLQVDRHDNTPIASMLQSGAAFDELQFVPAVDNKGSLGTNALRWALIRGTAVVSGDMHLLDEERGAHWKLREEPDHIAVINMLTKKRYRLPLDPDGDASEDELADP